jgi:DHA3 family macrolide efflux protein-like MFS transporter
MQASTSLMVPKEHLSRVAGMNQTLQGILNIVSPPLGAFLMSVLPLHSIMAIDVVTAAFAIGPLLFVHIPQPSRREFDPSTQEAKPSLWQDVKEGFAYIWHWRGVFMVLVIATLFNLLINPGFSLLPILVTRHFGGEAMHLAWMNSAWGFGVILGGLTLSVWGGFDRRILTSLLGLFGMSVGILVLGFAPSTAFWVGWGGMLLAGFMNPIVNGPFFAILQDVVAPDLQGRVFMVVGSISAAASPLGMAMAGPVADWLGVQVWFIVGGTVSLLIGACMPFVPPIMHLEDRAHPAAKARGGEPSAEPALR